MKLVVTTAIVAALCKFCPTDAALMIATDERVRKIEAVLHELSHAVVLSIPLYRGIEVKFVVHDWFLERPEQPDVCDVSECRALAVEKLAIESLGLEVDWCKVCGYAAEPMLGRMSTKEVKLYVDWFMKEPIARRRANKVVRAVLRVARKCESTNHLGDRDEA
jgi:hypothetical protein